MADRQFRRRDGDPERGLEQEQFEQPLDRDDIARSRPRTPPGDFMREVRGELRKVAWPNREEVVSYTVVVIVATLALIAIVFGMDAIFERLAQLIYG
jgi:preprotein translocase subunit SecE